MLENVAGKECAIATENALANKGKKMDLKSAPHEIFTMPQVAALV